MNKKQLPVLMGGLVVVLLIIGGVAFAINRLQAPTDGGNTAQTKKKKAEPVNVIAVDQRPYLQIVPEADGRNLSLVVESVKKSATEVEYELEYQAGSQLQGAFGLLKLDSLPVRFKILLGSCSAGGACTYHENVQGGSLLTKYTGPENFALKSDWRYIDNKAKATAISSTDAKFQLDAKNVGTQRYLVIFNTPGYPAGLTGTPVSDPYSLTAAAPLTGDGTLTMRATEEGSFTIMGWNGTAWKSFPTTMDGKSATASVELMELYILVK